MKEELKTYMFFDDIEMKSLSHREQMTFEEALQFSRVHGLWFKESGEKEDGNR